MRPVALLIMLCGCAADPAPKDLVWVHTSAEYAALCMQTFNGALRVLDSTERRMELPPAVVLDLDETVLDTFDFQLGIARGDIDLDEESWSRWVHSDRAQLVPGVKRFIEELRKRNIRVIFMSNRRTADRDASLVTLRRLGVVPRSEQPDLFLREHEASKDERRRRIESEYEVLAYFGDNLADLDRSFEEETVAGRYRAVCSARERFGLHWFVLPNPMYGNWQKAAAAQELEAMRPTCD